MEGIKLTKEIESNDHKLAFLDCQMQRGHDNELEMNVFRKLDYGLAYTYCTKVTAVDF